MKAERHEHLRYWVQSESNPEKEYLVDLAEWKCDCPNFQCVRSQQTPPEECKHFEVAILAFGREMLAEIRAQTKPYTGP